MKKYKVVIEVVDVKGYCPLYKEGDRVTAENFYFKTRESSNICLHAFVSMSTLLSSFLHGVSAKDLGLSEKEDEGFLECPDPGPPYTKGGRVVFKLRRIPV